MKEAAPLLLAVNRVEGWAKPVRHRDVHVCFDDGSWRPATVLAWLSDPRRGWLIQLRWPDGQQEWRLHDRRYVHPL